MTRRIFQVERQPFTIRPEIERLTIEVEDDGLVVLIVDWQAHESTFTIPYDRLGELIAVLQVMRDERR